MRIGLHTSKAGSLERAALKAHEVGANCFQIFSSSPRTWRAGKPDPADIKLLKTAREKHDLNPLVIHDSYLINLASREPAIRTSSISAFRGEIERAIAIGADYLVMHPGNHKGQGVEEGLCGVIEGIEEAVSGIRSKTLQILLENTVGCGAQLGSKFEELRAMRELTQQRIDIEIGFCIDTCHCFASGRYNVATPDGLKKTVREMDTVLGLEHLKVIHTNDSKGAIASRLDRHANIGEGQIGLEGFRRILNHPKLKTKAFILETPVDNPGDDKKNVDTLKMLCGKVS
ncbi:MAG TPA: deoxyribonuclease IV [Bryobacteraceae bacterium]|nr:deoxyribonuclease IV [Bryobacteraceae bacterium]